MKKNNNKVNVEENTVASVDENGGYDETAFDLLPNIDELNSVDDQTENTANEQTTAAVNLQKTAKMLKARAKAHKAKARAKAKAEKAAIKAAIDAKTLPYKGGRWVKVHMIGEEFTPANNVMDISSNDGATITAQAIYTANTRNFEKAGYWLTRYLGHAGASDVLSMATNEINAKTKAAEKDATEVKASGDGWKCEIIKIAKGVYKTQIQWQRKKAA